MSGDAGGQPPPDRSEEEDVRQGRSNSMPALDQEAEYVPNNFIAMVRHINEQVRNPFNQLDVELNNDAIEIDAAGDELDDIFGQIARTSAEANIVPQSGNEMRPNPPSGTGKRSQKSAESVQRHATPSALIRKAKTLNESRVTVLRRCENYKTAPISFGSQDDLMAGISPLADRKRTPLRTSLAQKDPTSSPDNNKPDVSSQSVDEHAIAQKLKMEGSNKNEWIRAPDTTPVMAAEQFNRKLERLAADFAVLQKQVTDIEALRNRREEFLQKGSLSGTRSMSVYGSDKPSHQTASSKHQIPSSTIYSKENKLRYVEEDGHRNSSDLETAGKSDSVIESSETHASNPAKQQNGSSVIRGTSEQADTSSTRLSRPGARRELYQPSGQQATFFCDCHTKYAALRRDLSCDIEVRKRREALAHS